MKNKTSTDILYQAINMIENKKLRKLILDALNNYNQDLLNLLKGTKYEA